MTRDLPKIGDREHRYSRLINNAKPFEGLDCVLPPPWKLFENEELDEKYFDVMIELQKYNYTIVKEK